MSVNLNKVSFLYKYKIPIGYIFLIIVSVFLLIFNALNVPGGLNQAERDSVVKSDSIEFNNFETLFMVDMPYHLAQKISIHQFGLNSLSVKLPTVIFALLTIISIVTSLRVWFRPSIAIVGSILTATSAPFLYLAQNGSPLIMIVFWPAIIIALSSFIFKNRRSVQIISLVLLAIASGLSLYTPIVPLILIVLSLAVYIHPKVRFSLRKHIGFKKLILIPIFALFLFLPIVLAVFKNPNTIFNLFMTAPNLEINTMQNIKELFIILFNFGGPAVSEPFGSMLSLKTNTNIVYPFIILPTFLLLVFGVYRLFKHLYSVKSYLIGAYLVAVLPIIFINIQTIYSLIIPIAILVSIGIHEILDFWYKLFPINPYAKGFAILAVSLLVIFTSYCSGIYYYDTFTYSKMRLESNNDAALLYKLTEQNRKYTLYLSENEKPFYQVYKDVNKKNIDLQTKYEPNGLDKNSKLISTRENIINHKDIKPTGVLASDITGDDSVRFYTYKIDKN